MSVSKQRLKKREAFVTLIEKGEYQGYLITEDIITVFPEVYDSEARLERLQTFFRRAGIEVYEDTTHVPAHMLQDAALGDREHFDLASRLVALRDEGILIVGSGNIVHNLGVLQWDDAAEPYDWATRFNEYIKDCIARDDMEGFFAYPDTGDDARNSIPGPDHFWTLLYVLGARDGDPVEFHTDFIQYKSLSMTSLVFAD